jgi:hypothetical protein
MMYLQFISGGLASGNFTTVLKDQDRRNLVVVMTVLHLFIVEGRIHRTHTSNFQLDLDALRSGVLFRMGTTWDSRTHLMTIAIQAVESDIIL